jgi:hypothetical protein
VPFSSGCVDAVIAGADHVLFAQGRPCTGAIRQLASPAALRGSGGGENAVGVGHLRRSGHRRLRTVFGAGESRGESVWGGAGAPQRKLVDQANTNDEFL